IGEMPRVIDRIKSSSLHGGAYGLWGINTVASKFRFLHIPVPIYLLLFTPFYNDIGTGGAGCDKGCIEIPPLLNEGGIFGYRINSLSASGAPVCGRRSLHRGVSPGCGKGLPVPSPDLLPPLW